ncbi:hypothetical protein RGUI_2720 [Rhodovulum sp. P5]|uniref:YjbF family lipoprotein n=1 Tax=Rhodovulum sp. P5 TaxID=1564506 RepID=UPI0009C1E78F|nr:YjbF family lipoprotein [Rhodovulum sp. P5]ARE40861.1 hypothetical protein RGUI_2720 [Rhodovulum sp. P5]
MKSILFPLALACALAACASNPEQARNVRALKQALARDAATDFDPRFVTLIEAQAPMLQVGIIERQLSGTVLLERRDGEVETWMTPDGANLILTGGMLTGTKGLGIGLLGADVSAPLALVRSGQAGVVDRFHTYLTGDDHAVTRSYKCIVENLGPKPVDLGDGPVSAVLMRETCRNLDQSFFNLYWVAQGKIVQSRQWSGEFQGAISTRLVVK